VKQNKVSEVAAGEQMRSEEAQQTGLEKLGVPHVKATPALRYNAKAEENSL
jgi:hypothetical protein